MSTEKILENSQNDFFKVQREILQASYLSDEQFEKSLNLAARSLSQYILFRQNTINKLRE